MTRLGLSGRCYVADRDSPHSIQNRYARDWKVIARNGQDKTDKNIDSPTA
ncbi:hypothetical protein Pla22_05600 [Rubripirellula amarantea]|uniref:Uncharacterized protein n=1 Tax=Rubripirellula amarantea TaxID=2527999 RepID=A0A5C5WSY9_9BACT|nr:hypothetical protein Pla22_05600 [Rubripirellula amarantea]